MDCCCVKSRRPQQRGELPRGGREGSLCRAAAGGRPSCCARCAVLSWRTRLVLLLHLLLLLRIKVLRHTQQRQGAPTHTHMHACGATVSAAAAAAAEHLQMRSWPAALDAACPAACTAALYRRSAPLTSCAPCAPPAAPRNPQTGRQTCCTALPAAADGHGEGGRTGGNARPVLATRDWQQWPPSGVAACSPHIHARNRTQGCEQLVNWDLQRQARCPPTRLPAHPPAPV